MIISWKPWNLVGLKGCYLFYNNSDFISHFNIVILFGLAGIGNPKFFLYFWQVFLFESFFLFFLGLRRIPRRICASWNVERSLASERRIILFSFRSHLHVAKMKKLSSTYFDLCKYNFKKYSIKFAKLNFFDFLLICTLRKFCQKNMEKILHGIGNVCFSLPCQPKNSKTSASTFPWCHVTCKWLLFPSSLSLS